jgi:small subunit ribosomal protein S6
MALYEHVFLARQDLTQQQVDDLVNHYKGVIESNGGKIGRVENWGLKSLTYRVKKNRKAYYTLMDLDAPAKALNEMERQMGLSEDVLRFLTIKVDAHEEGPSAMLQKRDRDERGDRGFGDRDRGDRPRFGDRDRGDRPPRSFGDREGGGDRGDRPPRSFGDRDGGGDRGPRRPREATEGSAS